MISGFAKGYAVSGYTKYLQAAENAVEFIESKLASSDGRLRRTFKEGQSKLNAYLEDYAFYVNGLLDLFAVNSKQEYLDKSITYTDFMLQHFWDEKDGNLFFTSDDHEQLIARTKNFYDLATPSGNSIAASNLLRLHYYTQDNGYLEKAVRIMKDGSRSAAENPFGFGQMLNSIYLYVKKPIEVTVIVTDNSSSNTNNSYSLAAWLNRQFLPHGIIGIAHPSELESYNVTPILRGVKQKEDMKLRLFAKIILARSQSNRSKSWKGSLSPTDVYQELISYSWTADFLIAFLWHRYLYNCLRVRLDQSLRLGSEDGFK